MILVEDKIEGINVTVEIDETEDHHNWGGCPVLNTENYTRLFEAVDVLTVIKAVKTCKTVEEFISKVENTWSKDKIAEPIIRELNDLAIDKVFDAKVIHLNAKSGSLIISADRDGLFGAEIFEGH